MSSIWAGNPAEITPLLNSSVRVHRSDESAIDIIDHQIPVLLPQRSSDAAPLHFLRRLRRLLEELQPYQALYLAGLSILESIIVARVGKVAGSFYQIFLDQQTTELLSAMIHAGILYAACVATSAAGVWLSGQLSVQWRSHLTRLLHARYCTNIASFSLHSSPLARIDNPDQRMTAETATLCDALASAARLAAGAPFRVLYYSYVAWQYLGFRGVFTAFLFFIVFGAVQKVVVLPLARRVVVQEKKEGNLRFLHLRLRERGPDVAATRGAAAELNSLDSSLSAALENQKSVVNWKTAVTAATKGTDYSGALLNYALVGAAVFSGAAAAAGAGGSGGELAQFVSNASFASLSLIYSFTEMLDLGEQLSNLAALTARVVGLLEVLPPQPPPLAADSTTNSFNINSSHSRNTMNNASPISNAPMLNTAAIQQRNQDQELHFSNFATMLCPPTSAQFLSSSGSSSISMEISIHSLGRDLQNEVQGIFPDLFNIHQAAKTSIPFSKINQQRQQVLCVLTFQFAGDGRIDLSPDRSSPTLTIAAAEMDRLLENYMRWEAALRNAILHIFSKRKKITTSGEAGQHSTDNSNSNAEIEKEDVYDIWCDSIDPRTGMPLHGNPSPSNQRWSEVAAARALLHYDRRDAGICPLVVHPVHGTSAYPVSFFTNAPEEVLLEALSSLAAVDKEEEEQASGGGGGGNSQNKTGSSLFTNRNFSNSNPTEMHPPSSSPILLSSQNLSFSTPDGRKPLILNLNFSVSRGQWLLISGPNGAGKSTLLRVLSGIHPKTAGNISYNLNITNNNRNNNNCINTNDPFSNPKLAMFLPQRPLSAPGPTLWQQIVYPGTNRPLDHAITSILHDVGLGYLVERIGGNFDATEPCSYPLLENNENYITSTSNTRSGSTSSLGYSSAVLQQEMQEQWSSILSPGEFQRISVARILFHRPRLVLLDEPCSAMDDASAKKLLELVRAAGVTCITVAQDSQVYREMHAVHLKLGDHNGPSITSMAERGNL